MTNSTKLLTQGRKVTISSLCLSVNHIPYKSKKKKKSQIPDTLSSELSKLKTFQGTGVERL